MGNLLLAHADLLTVDAEDTLILDGAVAVTDGRIVEVGEHVAVAPRYPHHPVLEARGMVALPGFVNTHTHLAMTMLRSIADDLPLNQWLPVMWSVEQHLDDEALYAGSLLGVAEMIASGTTCFNDSYFVMRNTARAVTEAGLRADLGEGFIENNDRARAEGHLDAAKAFAQEWHGQANGRIRARLAPHSLYTCSADMVARACEVARGLGIGWNMHVSESAREIEVVGARARGATPVQHLAAEGLLGPELVIAHGQTLTTQDVDILVEHGVGVAHCPQAYGHNASNPFPNVTRWLQAGLKVGLGTDGPAGNNNLDMLEEMRFGAMAAKLTFDDSRLLPARQMIRLATRLAAAVLGLQDEIGSIEPGKKADMILLDFRQPHLRPYHNLRGHIVYSAHAGDVDTVIVDGRILYQGRRFLTLDIGEVLDRAQAAFERLLGRAGWIPSLQEPAASLAGTLESDETQAALHLMQGLVGRRGASRRS
jgi:5-methylthioadenosine/S-adenosylhomocysteine deaminase